MDGAGESNLHQNGDLAQYGAATIALWVELFLTLDGLFMANPNQPLKICMIACGKLLEPRSGGELRIRHLARELVRLGHQVDVVALVLRNHPAGVGQPEPNLTITQTHSLWLDLAAAFDRTGLIPITTLPRWLRPLRGRIRRWTARRRYDVVQFEFPWFARLYGGVAGAARIIYSAHNIESHYWAPRLARHWFGDWFARGLQRHELAAAKRAAGVTACSDQDRDWLMEQGELPARQVAVIPNGYDARTLSPPTPEERAAARRALGLTSDEKIALFIGHDTPPNRQAAAAILERMVPHTPAQGVRFVIVGRVCEAFPGAGSEKVRLAGRVADVKPYLHAADVGLNPITAGSGSNIKLAEYCAAGLPVVTTEFGLRGFEPLRPWMNLVELDIFAEAIEASRRPNSIPESALRPYSWQALAGRLEEFYQSLLNSENEESGE